MVIVNNDFIEKLTPYVCELFSVHDKKVFIDFRSLYFGQINEIGILADELEEKLISTSDKQNEVIKLDSNTGNNVFTAEFGSIYFFLGFVGEPTEFIVDDTFNQKLDNSTGLNSGFFFHRLACVADAPRRIYALRFRRTV